MIRCAMTILLRPGTAHRSVALSADGKHLPIDVWTSAGVIMGCSCSWLGSQRLDPIVALIVGCG